VAAKVSQGVHDNQIFNQLIDRQKLYMLGCACVAIGNAAAVLPRCAKAVLVCQKDNLVAVHLCTRCVKAVALVQHSMLSLDVITCLQLLALFGRSCCSYLVCNTPCV
jgi:hypothetical protein